MTFSYTAVALALLTGSTLFSAQQYMISTYAGGAPPSGPIAATIASVGAPNGLATDAADNVYFTGDNCVFRMDRNGVLIRVAGNSRAGFSGDGGSAATAQLSSPGPLAIDTAGNLYVADAGTRIRKISAQGIITTIAGGGGAGFPVDGGPATGGRLNPVSGMAVDTAGNLYFADFSFTVRKVSPAGIITTVVGSNGSGYSGDGGPAAAAQINGPRGLAVDSLGNLYIADSFNSRIRKVAVNGTITTVAGSGSYGYTGDGGPATDARIDSLDGVASDRAGNLYIASASTFRTRKISPAGIITTVYSGDAVPGTSGGLVGMGADSTGNLYLTDSFRFRVRKFSPAGTMAIAAGNGTFSYSGDGGPAIHAQLFGAEGIAPDAVGNLYIADTFNSRVRMVSPAGTITTVAGDGTYASSGDGGAAINAQLFRPQALAVDSVGNLYISDVNDIGRIRKVSPAGVITTVAGDGTLGFSGDGGPATSARVYSPSGLAVDRVGNLFIADSGNNRVRKISAAGIITTIAGDGTYGSGGEGGPATSAQLAHPFSVAADYGGNVYIFDQADYDRVTKVSPQGILTKMAGKGEIGGPPTTRQQFYVNGLATDGAGTVYFTDSFNYRVRSISPTGVIATIAGNGTPGYSGDGGLATNAQLLNPIGLGVDSAGSVYIADSFNNAIRRLQPISSSINVSAVINGASNTSGAVSPGEIVVLYGSELGPAVLTSFQTNSAGVDTELAGTTVSFNGTPASILYTSITQVGVIVPYEVSGTSAAVAVTWQGRTSPPMSVPVALSAPGLFTLDSTGQGQAVVLNQDGSLNSASNPAAPGSIVSMYATGEGQISPAGVNGTLAQDPLPHPLLPVIVTLGDETVIPKSAGGTANQVEGLMQISLQIPYAMAGGSNIPVRLKIGNNLSQTGVTLAIRGK